MTDEAVTIVTIQYYLDSSTLAPQPHNGHHCAYCPATLAPRELRRHAASIQPYQTKGTHNHAPDQPSLGLPARAKPLRDQHYDEPEAEDI